MITILATIVILGVLIFVHELGHFATAKWMDIEVPRFSIGLGPKMFGFTRGETEYVVAWLPLGGYVRMAGMDDMQELEGGEYDASTARETGRDFESKSLPARALVISAGVIMNILFAWFLFSVIALVWGVSPTPEPVVGDLAEELVPPVDSALLSVQPGWRITAVNGNEVETWSDVQRLLSMARDTVRLEFAGQPALTVPVPDGDTARSDLVQAMEPRIQTPALVGTVTEGSPAAAAGLQSGDVVVEAGGRPVTGWQDLVAALEPHPGQPVPLVVERDGRRVALTVTPAPTEVAGGAEIGRIGVMRSPVDLRTPLGPIQAAGWGLRETGRITKMILQFLGGLFTGQASPRDVGGPILIYKISEQVVQVGFDAFLQFMALFSINLAVLNLLPIPILDGGQLLFLAVEGIRGRALSTEQRIRLSQVGLVIVVAIMVWALANDVLRLFGV